MTHIGSEGRQMSELEKVELEYRQLQSRLVYAEFEGLKTDPRDERRFRQLVDRRINLTAPDFAALAV